MRVAMQSQNAYTLLKVMALPIHTRAALLLGGWLLLAPPVDDKSQTGVALDAPLTTWKQVEAFDTATACERGKAAWAKISFYEAHPHTGPPKDAAASKAFLQHVYSRCVPAESVYNQHRWWWPW